MKCYKSITKRLLFFFTSFTIAVTMLTATYCYFSYRSILKESLRQSAESSLQMLFETIQYDMDNALSLMDFCVTNETIAAYLNASNTQQANTKALSNHAWQRLREEYHINSSFIFFNRIIIFDLNENYIQYSTFDIYQNRPLATLIKEQVIFDSPYQNPDRIQTGFISDPISPFTPDNLVIPIIQPIHSAYGEKTSGWCYLALSPNIFINRIKTYNLASDSELYLTIGGKTYLWKNTMLEETSFRSGLLPDGLDDEKSAPSLVTAKGTGSSWYLSQTISQKALALQSLVYLSTFLLIAGIVIALGVAITLYLHRSINLPIKKLQKKLSLISAGDFSPDLSIEWNNELGEIGKGINDMSRAITKLIQSRMEDQEKKFELEYEVLQNQVNPHFLYNTLNSITWMATAQGSRGISEMVAALSFLLKSVSKKNAQKHTIREELELLDSYFLIQKYRYGGILSMKCHVESECIYDCLIIKFIFQIIVENSIFHGIEPKEAPGIIDISVQYCNQQKDIVISIMDNGIGMTEEMIHSMLAQEAGTSELFNKIGIHNIRKRMEYTYGPGYDIVIQSVPDEYTKVIITIPRQTKEDSNYVQTSDC